MFMLAPTSKAVVVLKGADEFEVSIIFEFIRYCSILMELLKSTFPPEYEIADIKSLILRIFFICCWVGISSLFVNFYSSEPVH